MGDILYAIEAGLQRCDVDSCDNKVNSPQYDDKNLLGNIGDLFKKCM